VLMPIQNHQCYRDPLDQMKLISLYLPTRQLRFFERLIAGEYFKNRSEIIRRIIDLFLDEVWARATFLDLVTDEQLSCLFSKDVNFKKDYRKGGWNECRS
jgi:Arc/MetJ-type ribon-helix-helix transcriptional regulator